MLAILNSGSEISIATSSLVNRLGLPTFPICCQIEGIDQFPRETRGSIRLKIQSIHSAATYEFGAFLTENLWSALNKINKQRFTSIELAESDFGEPGRIQLFLGAEAFAELLSTDEPTVISGKPAVVCTKFDYIITG